MICSKQFSSEECDHPMHTRCFVNSIMSLLASYDLEAVPRCEVFKVYQKVKTSMLSIAAKRIGGTESNVDAIGRSGRY